MRHLNTGYLNERTIWLWPKIFLRLLTTHIIIFSQKNTLYNLILAIYIITKQAEKQFEHRMWWFAAQTNQSAT